MTLRKEIIMNATRRSVDSVALFRVDVPDPSSEVRTEEYAVSARAISDHLECRIQYVCGVLDVARLADPPTVQRLGKRCKYTYCACAPA